MGALNPGRLAALRVLVGVEKGLHADDLLSQKAPPEGPDRALSWHIVLGVLRRQGSLDHSLASCVRGGLKRLDPPVRAALRMGLFEIWVAGTKPHAAVDQAVRASRAAGGGRGAGLVNAVLRKLSQRTSDLDESLNLPEWQRSRWGGHTEWVKSLASPSPLHGVWNGSRRADLETAPLDPERGTFALPTGTGRVDALPGFKEGDWWVMDAGSVRCADTLGDTLEPESRVLDCCAAPGGKSMRLASQGHHLVAVDARVDRLAQVEEASTRLGLGLGCAVHDWEEGPSESLGLFDGVLVDAPCTGLGTIRRRPEIRWRRLPSDPAAMAIRQFRILRHASMHVRVGGKLVYSVCSPTLEEGRGVVSQLEGWEVRFEWCNMPPEQGEDVFQCFLLEKETDS